MSTATLTRLVEEQNTTWTRMQEIMRTSETEGRDLTAEEAANWDAAEARLTVVSRDIERINRHTTLATVDRSQIITTSGGEGVQGDEAEQSARYAAAFNLYMRGGMDRLTAEQRMLMAAREAEVRSQGTGTDTAGGFLVPDEFRGVLTETMKAYGGLLNLANVITTSTGADLAWPTNDDTGNEGEFLGEGQPVTNLDMLFGGRKLKAFTVTSRQIQVNLQLLQDSAFNLDAWLPSKLGERIGRRSARAFITGTGVDQPEGITTSIGIGKTGAGGQVTSIIYDDLVDLEHSIDPAYRAGSQFLMHDTTLKVIRKLKDSQGRPLWVPIPAPGFPATVDGFAYTLDNSMPVPAASAKSIVFGDFKAGYLIRQVLDVQMMRLVERYAEYLQVGFIAFSRLDGMIDDPAAIKAYQHPAS